MHDLAAVAGAGSGCSSSGHHALTEEEDGGVGDDDGDEKFNGSTGDHKSRWGIGSFVSLFIDGISNGPTYQQIKYLFALFGRITSVFLQRKRKEGRRWHFAFVWMMSRRGAMEALSKLDGARLNGSFITVSVAKFPRAKSASDVARRNLKVSQAI